MQVEIECRGRLDKVVQQWLHEGRWPLTLDGSDRYFLDERLSAAKRWLEVLTHAPGCVEGNSEMLAINLEALLVAGWKECFLEKHIDEMGARMFEYQDGLGDRNYFSE